MSEPASKKADLLESMWEATSAAASKTRNVIPAQNKPSDHRAVLSTESQFRKERHRSIALDEAFIAAHPNWCNAICDTLSHYDKRKPTDVSGTERARRFTSRAEAREARPRLDPDALIPLAHFADLIGDYKFARIEYVLCQLVDDKGKCKRSHGWGWIAQLSDGTEGYIGHNCAEDHFESDPRFKALFEAASARVDREISTDLLIARLTALLENKNLHAALNAAGRKLDDLSDRVLRLRSLLHPKIQKNLADRVKRGDASVFIRVLYLEPEQDEQTGDVRQVLRPREVLWGSLSGLSAPDIGVVERIGKRVAAATAAISEAVASLDQDNRQMRKWAAALEGHERIDREINERQTIVDAFCRPENLKLLWVLASQRLDQIAIASTVLELITRKLGTEAEAIAARDAWAQQIRDAHAGHEFEIL